MRKATFLGVAVIILSVHTLRADVLAAWTFESVVSGSWSPGANTQSTSFLAEEGRFAGTAAAFGFHAGAATYTVTFGNGSAKSLSSGTWTSGDYYEFSMPLNLAADRFSAFSVTYDQNGLGNSPKTYYLAYSLDDSTFTKIGSDYVLSPGILWGTATPNQGTQLSYDLSGISALLAGADNLYFRIVDDSPTAGGAINGGNIGIFGTDRVDNFTVNAIVVAVPEPSAIALSSVGGILCLFALRRGRRS